MILLSHAKTKGLKNPRINHLSTVYIPLFSVVQRNISSFQTRAFKNSPKCFESLIYNKMRNNYA